MNSAWAERLQNALGKLRRIDFGYPLGENVIRPLPSGRDARSILEEENIHSPDLASFYGSCDGVSLPDVQNGYFLMSLLELVDGLREKEPRTVVGRVSGSMVVFGWTGGGQRFALMLEGGSIWWLGNGLVEDRVFYSEEGNARKIASDLPGFLLRLAEDAEAFVADEQGHSFIA